MDVDEACKVILKNLNDYIDATYKDVDKQLMCLVYAQLLNDKINELDKEPHQNGKVWADLISDFIELNRANLGLYNALSRAILEKKNFTIH